MFQLYLSYPASKQRGLFLLFQFLWLTNKKDTSGHICYTFCGSCENSLTQNGFVLILK